MSSMVKHVFFMLLAAGLFSASLPGCKGKRPGPRRLIPGNLPEVITDQEARKVCQGMNRFFKKVEGDKPAQRRLAATYQPFVRSPGPEGPVHLIPYHGVYLPIPVRPYRIGLSYNSRKREFGLVFLLKKSKELISLYPMIGAEPHYDIFHRRGEPLTDRRKAYTRKLFGKYPNLFDIRDLGYRITPAGYSCTPKNLYTAIRNLFLFTMKSIGGPMVRELRAHRGVGLAHSILSTGLDRRGYYILQYSYRHRDRYHTLDALLKGKENFQALRRLLPRIAAAPGARGLAVQPLPGQLGRLVRFAGKPTPREARALTMLKWDGPLKPLPSMRRELTRYLTGRARRGTK